jgi:acyl carrier protein
MTTAPDLGEELEFIYSVLAAQADYDGELHPGLGFADLELDSLGIMTLLVEAEDHFEVALDETDEAGLLTLGDLALTFHCRRLESDGADR